MKAHDPEYSKPSKPRILLFGPPDSDKSRFGCEWPNSVYIDTENGASESEYIRSLKASNSKYLGVADGSRNLNEIIDEVKGLIVTPGDRQNLIVDSVSESIDSTDAEEQERMGEDKKDPFSSYKKVAVKRLRRLSFLLNQLDMGVVLVAHAKDKWEGEGEKRKCVGQTFDAWSKLGHKMNLQAQAVRVGGVTFMQVIRSKYESIKRGQEIPMTYAAFAQAFGKDIMERKAEGLIVATPEQVEEITKLTGILRMEPEELEGFLNKMSAEEIVDLSKENAEKFIKYLDKKRKGEIA